MMNRNLVLLAGPSAVGKSTSLKDLKDPEGVLYCNCESGKELPFPSQFKQLVVTDPHQVFQAFEKAEKHDDCHTIIIDSLTYLMDMYESKYVLTAANPMKSWSDYAQYFKKLMQHYVASSAKNVIFTAHTMNQLNEGEMVVETLVKVKGALMNQGVESYFNNVIGCKKLPLTKLEGYSNPALHISEDDEMLGFKYVYQTRLTKETVNERIRGPIKMWSQQETFIDNNLQEVLDRLHTFYS